MEDKGRGKRKSRKDEPSDIDRDLESLIFGSGFQLHSAKEEAKITGRMAAGRLDAAAALVKNQNADILTFFIDTKNDDAGASRTDGDAHDYAGDDSDVLMQEIEDDEMNKISENEKNSNGESSEESEEEDVLVVEEEGVLDEVYSVWKDNDDTTVEVSLGNTLVKKLRVAESEDTIQGPDFERRLRRQYERLYPPPNWYVGLIESRKRGSDDEHSDGSDDDDRVQYGEGTARFIALPGQARRSVIPMITRAKLAARKRGILSPDHLHLQRLQDANKNGYTNGSVLSMAFHPHQTNILMTAGMDKTLRLFQVDGKVNPKIQFVHIKNFPVHSAKFTPDGSKIYLSGRRPFYYTFDMECGRLVKVPGLIGGRRGIPSFERFSISPNSHWIAFSGAGGIVSIVEESTRRFFADVKVNGNVKDACWDGDDKLMVLSDDFQIYQFDIRQTARCVMKYIDNDNYGANSILIDSNNKYLVTG